jgi:hypothetical protein
MYYCASALSYSVVLLLGNLAAHRLSTMSLIFALQALLIRHESYVADAEESRHRMEEKVDKLEQEKQDLLEQNARTVDENRKLTDQLETLSTACAESELKILSMGELLRSTDQELERLTGLAARTEGLQIQLGRLEDEQMALHATLTTSKEEEHAVLLRWQKAERMVLSLQDQIDRIERDAREERERHEEVVERMERRRAVEAELRLATGRVRGAATLPQDENGGNVVSYFVKDILQDNANLQLGIVELKEMLDRSNEEVERLRRQSMNQPERPTSPQRTPSLGAELGAKELHVHHHYHAPKTVVEPAKTSRTPVQRRSRKKRVGLTSGSSSGTTTPRSSISVLHSPGGNSAASAILAQTSVTIPPQRLTRQRWSTQSNQTGFTSSSSLPSSPYTDSVFDRVYSDIATDMSRPTSPESNGALSPTYTSSHVDYSAHQRSDSIPRLSLDAGMRTSSEGAPTFSQQLTNGSRSIGKGKAKRESFTPDFDAWQAGHSTILEENEDMESNNQDTATGSSEDQYGDYTTQLSMPRLRRAASHESMISISGMDIHTLQSRPSQLLGGRMRLSSSPSTASSQAVISGASAIALRPSVSRTDNDSRAYLSGIAATQRKPLAKKASTGTLGQIGGWVRGRWGYAATTTAPTTAPTTTSTASDYTASISSGPKSVKSASSVLNESGAISKAPLTPSFRVRSPGINQPGPILGFAPEPKLPKQVISTGVDEDALRECLENG